VRRASPRSPRHPAGFTLVELVVALAVFAVVMTVVVAAWVSQQQSFALQAERAEVQACLRQGFETLEREVRNAGSGIPPAPPVRLPDGWGGGSPAFLVSGLGVLDGGPGGPDTLVVAHALSPPVHLIRGMATGSSDLAVGPGVRWEPGMLGIISDGSSAEIFRVSRVDGGSLLQHAGGGIFHPSLSKPYPEGAAVSPVRLAGYAVRAPDGSAGPALVRRGIDRGGNLFARSVAEGIEDVQLQLLLPDDPGREGTQRSLGPGMSHPYGLRIRLVARGRYSGRSRPVAQDAVVALRYRGGAA